jgi:hypothetical protein
MATAPCQSVPSGQASKTQRRRCVATQPSGISRIVTRPLGLHDDEYAALRRLQRGAIAQPAEHPVWTYLVAQGLVWIDWEMRPPSVRLTTGGRSYPED